MNRITASPSHAAAASAYAVAPERRHRSHSVSGPAPSVASRAVPAQANPARKPSTLRELGALALKIAVIVAALAAVFAFVFGLYRAGDTFMAPNIKDGDLVLVDRLDRSYIASDVVAFEYLDKTRFGRVVAVAGDTVDIHDDALYVNGSYQQETWAQGPTTRFEGGADFPLTVPEGSVFVLGDNRASASDSRVIGCIAQDDTQGQVVGFFRRRNL